MLTAAGTGFVINAAGDGLAPLPADRTYQLWGVVGSTGDLAGPARSPTGDRALQRGRIARRSSAFAITDEVAGGVVASTHQPVAEGTVQV